MKCRHTIVTASFVWVPFRYVLRAFPYVLRFVEFGFDCAYVVPIKNPARCTRLRLEKKRAVTISLGEGLKISPVVAEGQSLLRPKILSKLKNKFMKSR